MLPYAALAWREHKARAFAAASIWLVATLYSSVAAMGFAALKRANTVAAHQQQAELHATLEMITTCPKWRSSAGCADAIKPQTQEFCAHYRAVAAQV
jgi:hypothetical protein